jgi:anti-sigma regulatory factor (Ser/Thr protein kinase)
MHSGVRSSGLPQLPLLSDDDKDHFAVEAQTVGFQEFAPLPASLAEVRRFVRSVLEDLGIGDDRIFECQLIADELAANAIQHAGTGYSVGVELTDTSVRVAVRDDSDVVPVARLSSAEALGGRGLSIVAGTASGWGTVPLGLGKETWADVQCG